MKKTKKTSSYTYRKIWQQYNNVPIPVDSNGRTYEIHHIDGNRDNNTKENLLCISIEDHYKIHLKQKDWGACTLIAKRMNLPSNHISLLQTGKKRPGIGGAPKGRIPWNKGKRGYCLKLSPEGKLKKIEANNAKKMPNENVLQVLSDYNNFVEIKDDKLGRVQKNGVVYSYKTAFVNHYAKIYKVTPSYIRRILDSKARVINEK